ncbi:MAG: MBL fold metallo-hydrolase, partial [Pseudomonadota bacterium]
SLHSLAALSLQGLGSAFAQNNNGVTPLRGSLSVLDAGGSNVVVCATDAGLVLVDSGAPAYSKQLMTALAGINSGHVHTLFNTHWHAEQCGGNEAIGDTGASIIAHAKTWQRLSTEYYLPHEARYLKALPKAARPTVKVHDKGTLQVGNTAIDYGTLIEAHTDGDLYVYFRDANVLAAGGAASSDSDPELDWYGGGWLGGRANSLDTLVQLTNADTLIVPQNGRVMTQAELIAERDMTHELYKRLNTLIRKGCSADCMQQEDALAGLSRSWQQPDKFLYAAYKGLWAHHYNLAADIL